MPEVHFCICIFNRTSILLIENKNYYMHNEDLVVKKKKKKQAAIGILVLVALTLITQWLLYMCEENKN